MTPKVSVLLPVHNAAVYLTEAVESILGQTISDFELICIDDGSTDGSPAILQGFAAQDERVRLVRREHRGLIAALNEGLRIARAPLVARMDADDISLPERLELQYRRFQLDANLWVLGTAEERIDAAGQRRGRHPVVSGCDAVAKALRENCIIRHPSVMMRRDPIQEIGGYRPAYKHAEDYDLWLRVSEHGKLDNLDVVALRYRMHSGSVSERHTVRQRLSAELARASHVLRRAGHEDPTASLNSEPDLWTDPLLDRLIPAHAMFFRFVDLAFRACSDQFDPKLARRMLRSQDRRVVRANRRLWQEALICIAETRDGKGLLWMESLAAAFRTNPGRFIQKISFSRRNARPDSPLRRFRI